MAVACGKFNDVNSVFQQRIKVIKRIYEPGNLISESANQLQKIKIMKAEANTVNRFNNQLNNR